MAHTLRDEESDADGRKCCIALTLNADLVHCVSKHAIGRSKVRANDVRPGVRQVRINPPQVLSCRQNPNNLSIDTVCQVVRAAGDACPSVAQSWVAAESNAGLQNISKCSRQMAREAGTRLPGRRSLQTRPGSAAQGGSRSRAARPSRWASLPTLPVQTTAQAHWINALLAGLVRMIALQKGIGV